jgi:hypothetical protein
MSDVWSTHLSDTRPNRRHSTVPKLQCCGHCSERFYLTSIAPAFAAAAERQKGTKASLAKEAAERLSCLTGTRLLIERVCINISPNQWQFLPRVRQDTVRAPYGGGVGCNREFWAAA